MINDHTAVRPSVISKEMAVDHAFSSSSTAASVIYGGSASGPAMWKDENGVSLGELNK